jgi:hypothetical protein
VAPGVEAAAEAEATLVFKSGTMPAGTGDVSRALKEAEVADGLTCRAESEISELPEALVDALTLEEGMLLETLEAIEPVAVCEGTLMVYRSPPPVPPDVAEVAFPAPTSTGETDSQEVDANFAGLGLVRMAIWRTMMAACSVSVSSCITLGFLDGMASLRDWYG